MAGISRVVPEFPLDRLSTEGSQSSFRNGGDYQQLRSFCSIGPLEKAWDALVCMDEGVVLSVDTYRYLLQACTKCKGFLETKQVHAHIVKNGLECNSYLGNFVVNVLVKCGSLSDALVVFRRLPLRTTVSWSAIILSYSKNGQEDEALKMYWQMQQERAEPNKFIFLSILKACGKLEDLKAGKQIHADIVSHNYDSDLFVGTTLVDMYAKCGSMMDARCVFDGLSQRDVISWNAMITGYVQHGQEKLALQLYANMQAEGVMPNARTFVGVAKACGSLAAMEVNGLSGSDLVRDEWLKRARDLHSEIDRMGYGSDPFVANSLVSMYSCCGSIQNARHVFDTLAQRSVVSWTTMIAAYAQHEQAVEALRLYVQMQQQGVKANDRTYVSVLKACASLAAEEESTDVDEEAMKLSSLQLGREIHAEILKDGYESDMFVCNTLLHMYANCGSLSEAETLFEKLPHRDVVSWNAMIAAFAQFKQGEQALQFYVNMQYAGIEPNCRTFVSILKACSSLAAPGSLITFNQEVAFSESLTRGKVVHAELLRRYYDSDVFICNYLLHFYTLCDSLLDVRQVFENLNKHDVISFSLMIAAYAKQGQAEQALNLYVNMLEEGVSPDEQTFMSLLKACSSLAGMELETLVDGHALRVESLIKGKAIHSQIVQLKWETELFMATTLVDMYANCGSMVDAEEIFGMLSQHDGVTFNAMIAGYGQQNRWDEVLQLYATMQETHVQPTEATFVCLLKACSTRGSLRMITEVHRDAVQNGFSSSIIVVNSLIHAYGRCGSMEDAQGVFNSFSDRDRVSWNTLIAGYARFGNCEKSLLCYEQMQEARVNPDVVTFVTILSACSHAGMVDGGLEYFESMCRDHNISPVAEHYVSMIDLLVRAGLLSRVKSLLSNMTVQPNVDVWMAVLGACRKFVDVELARYAFECAVRIEPTHSAAYMLMSNIYAHLDMWDDVANIEQMRMRAAAYKKPGQSWIEHKGRIHSFQVGTASDQQHEPLDVRIRELAVLLDG